MKIRYPDESVMRAEPRLAELRDNAVYYLLMRRRRGAFRPNWNSLTIVAAFVSVVLIYAVIEWFLPRGVGGLGGLLGIFFLFIAYHIRRAARMKIAQDFLGFDAAEFDQYALLPITAEDIVIAHWGKEMLFRTGILVWIFGGIGLGVMLIGFVIESRGIVFAGGFPVTIGSYWFAMGPYWGSKMLMRVEQRSWFARQALLELKQQNPGYIPGSGIGWALAWLTIPPLVLLLVWAESGIHAATFLRQPAGIVDALIIFLMMSGWGLLAGLTVGRVTKKESRASFENAVADVRFILRAAFDRMEAEEQAVEGQAKSSLS